MLQKLKNISTKHPISIPINQFLGIFGVIYILMRQKHRKLEKIVNTRSQIKRQTIKPNSSDDCNVHVCKYFQKIVKILQFIINKFLGEEIIDKKSQSRNVVVSLCQKTKQIIVKDFDATLLRATNINVNEGQVYIISDKPITIISNRHNYDLVLKFPSTYLLQTFINTLENFSTKCNVQFKYIKQLNWSSAQKIIVTKNDRQKKLEMFFRVVFAQAFKIQHRDEDEMLKVGDYEARQIVNTELTIDEFAEALSMKPCNEFVKRMFSLVDKDRNGFISFREFIDLLIIFANGTNEEKARLLFNMYNINGTGLITAADFVQMIKTFLETVDGTINEQHIENTVKSMMRTAGIQNKNNLDFNDFKNMIGKDINKLNAAKLGFKGVNAEDRRSYLHRARQTLENIYE